MSRFIFFCLLLTSFTCWAGNRVDNDGPKPDSIINLKEVAIVSSSLHSLNTSSFQLTLPSKLISKSSGLSLQELLGANTSLAINQYGNGGLSTVSIRGAGSSHTAVLWNGISLQSPMNGGVNFSLIPAILLDEVAISHGGQGSLYGSGSVGGTIQLNTLADVPHGMGVTFVFNAGSFSNYFSGLKLNFGSLKYALSLRTFWQDAKNNFEYLNYAKYGHPIEKLQHNTLTQYGALASFLYKITNNQQLTLRAWGQFHNKDLPPLMTSEISKQNEKNSDLRLSADWTGNHDQIQWTLQSAFVSNKNHFVDSISLTDAVNLGKTLQNRAELTWFFIPQHRIVFQLLHLMEQGESDNYSNDITRHRISFMAGYRFAPENGKYSLAASGREEMVEGNFKQPTFSAGGSLRLVRYLDFQANISKSYRIPTLNDLYWAVWGNPDLKPENGLNQDIGLHFNRKADVFSSELNLSVFNNDVTNWIIWIPEGSIWTPKNIRKVHGRGLESKTALKYNISNNWSIDLSGSYQYTKTTQAGDKDALAYDKQLIYIPKHKVTVNASIGYKEIQLNYSFRYTGKRYIDELNIEKPLPSYSLNDLSLISDFRINNSRLSIKLSVNNLFDIDYQSVAWYPMPGRNYLISLIWSYNNFNNLTH